MIYFYQALVNTKHLDDWTEYVISLAKILLLENNIHDKSKLEQYDDIANYCRGLTYNLMELDPGLDNPEFIFKYDIQSWYDDNSGNIIEKFQFSEARKVMFSYNKEETELFKNNMNIYGTSINGMAQVLKRIPKHFLWRHPTIVS